MIDGKACPAPRRVIETAAIGTRHQSQAEITRWTCIHGQHVGQGCVTCYQSAAEADPALPLWKVAVWFTSPRPIPIKVLHDVHRHGRDFALDQPSTPLVFVLTGQARADQGVEAVAGVVGFLLRNRHTIDGFTVTEVHAVHV
ncbi:hypothetical protein ACIBI9_40000 [Nonomuraea sp. NPDC050451]|uniref:hypothetical protein n=1 Tax=Nonomuraea sp. NPDC050451 TaxID=3364364 RepID=UPI0037BA21A1